MAARFAGQSLPSNARRVAVKVRLVNLKCASPTSTATHLRYIEREGVGQEGQPGIAYGPESDQIDVGQFEGRGHGDRHQFRFIVSPEDAEQLDDLKIFSRQLMGRMASDLGTRLDWVAVDHWNTDNPHTHVVLRGKDDAGKDLIISKDYISRGMRERAAELATEWLGPRTELEIQQGLQREVMQERWTTLDRSLLREVYADGSVRLGPGSANTGDDRWQNLRAARLKTLQRMGLASEDTPNVWTLNRDVRETLQAMGERNDIIRTMQRAMGGAPRDLAIQASAEGPCSVVGRIIGKGHTDELDGRGYLIVDGIDGRTHYAPLPARADLSQFPREGIVEITEAKRGTKLHRPHGLTRPDVNIRLRSHFSI
ncbi:MAG: DUF3363 domain-containing protein [Janthinobacterium lividum]